MERKDIVAFLKTFVKKQKSEVNYGTYRETTRSSLLNDGLGTRANSVWKQSQFIVAYWSNISETDDVSEYLKGWSELTRGIFDQYLLLECPRNTWTVYDKHGNIMKLDDLKFVPQKYIDPHNVERAKNSNKTDVQSRQIIFYGTPGTGKSHKIKKILGEYDGCPEDKKVPKANIFRTTFHPDSDYSTFVGAYKPTMKKQKDEIYTKEELISKLTEMKEGGVTYSPQKFGAKYWRSLKQLNLADKKDILQACGMSDNYTVEFDKGIAVGEEYLIGLEESRIIYSFVPQAFLNAYIRAYQTDENVYLIIEEINRGNCAQIFGDLFQLLDRDMDGKSEYTIKADADLRAFLEEKLGENNPGIKDGELCMPSNLYIYATMNTSDQSLFPIDSAFKRRWDWEYEPIKYKNADWAIDIDRHRYSWTAFQSEVNKRIFDATHSEDKMLGDYFVNPADGVITADLLRNKVLFYLWNDVCKDGEGDIFRISETDEIKFSDLYGENGKDKLLAMLNYLLEKSDEGGTEARPETETENQTI